MSVSEAELAALIAGLQPSAIAAAPVTAEHVVAIGGDCPYHGPWPAGQRRCPDCGNTAAAAAAPVMAPDGPPPSTVTELRQVLMDYEASRPRSLQRSLGPSELGTPCQGQIARKLAGCPRAPVTAPTWAPWCGTQVHSGMEQVVAYWNRQLGRERWLAEARLVIHPGVEGVDAIRGSSDAYDTDHETVVDWKFVGKTALTKLQRGQRMGKPPEEQVSQEYRVQAHLYGYGQERAGRRPRWVRLVLLARSHDYDESAEWTEAYKPEVAIAAIDRYFATHDLLSALDVAAHPDMIAAVPTTPTRDACKWCVFSRPGQPNTWGGCPGDRPLEKVISHATDGLIEAA